MVFNSIIYQYVIQWNEFFQILTFLSCQFLKFLGSTKASFLTITSLLQIMFLLVYSRIREPISLGGHLSRLVLDF